MGIGINRYSKRGPKKGKKSGSGKYNNEEVLTATGEKADSKLEARLHDLLTKFKVPFEFQKKFHLQDKFIDPNGKAVTHITLTVDFYVKDYNGCELIIDTKGHCTEPSILRYKMLEYKLQQEGREYTLIFPRDQSNVDSCAFRMKEGHPVANLYKKPY